MQLPSRYLDLTLRDVLALQKCAPPRGERVAVEAIHAAVDAIAQQADRERRAREADQREFLAECFDDLAPDTTEGSPDADR